MELKKENYGYFLGGALLGGFAGALAGILFAPKSGRELRSDLRHKGEEAYGGARRAYSETETRAKNILNEAMHRAEELKRQADRQVCEAYSKAKRTLCREKEAAAVEYADEPRADA
jgi:gas vesicle protein